MWGKWSISRPGRFKPGKVPFYPFNGRLGGPQTRSEQMGGQETLLSLLGFEPLTVQPVARTWYRRLFFINMYHVTSVPGITHAINPVNDTASLGGRVPRSFGELWYRHLQRLRSPRLESSARPLWEPAGWSILSDCTNYAAGSRGDSDTFCQLSRHVAARW